MIFRSAFLLAASLGLLAHGLSQERAAWPDGPFRTSGRNILNASGQNVTYAGANWPGAGETMLPEGLQYQSIETIVSKIKSIGMNSIRLTFAIQMVDEIYANGGNDIPIRTAFVNALGQANGDKVYNQVISKNPQFGPSTTRLQVFDAVAAECAKQQVYVHLDNHMSRAAWCCSTDDGNAWFGDRDYSTDNWLRGLQHMASHGRSWAALRSMALRNELRQPASGAARATYNWQTWYANVRRGAAAVRAGHPDLLVFLSGLDFDTTLGPVVRGEALGPGSERFGRADFPGLEDRLVLELHNYETGTGSCSGLQSNLNNAGFGALAAGQFPVLLTEFGFAQDASTWRSTYSTCLASYLPAQKAGWMIWVVSGSYYIRQGTQDYDEAWGLLSHDWSTWRSPSYVNGLLTDMVKKTLS